MTREEAIERLDLCQNVCDDCLTCASHDEALDMAIAALREQDSNANQHVSNTSNALGGWISVEERLPEVESSYLTYTDKGSIIIDSFCIYPEHGTKFWVGGNGRVTHWMPLPEAPKEEV